MNFFDVIEELVRERNLDRSVLHDIVQEGVLSAYEKKYPSYELRVDLNSYNVIEKLRDHVLAENSCWISDH